MHFEEFFHLYYKKVNPITRRKYLPIYWTLFYVGRKYNAAPHTIKERTQDLQLFLDNLDPSQKYFTLIDLADGIQNDVSSLDLMVLAGGGAAVHNTPLLTMPCNLTPKKEKGTFASFIGVVKGRHPLREKMQHLLKNKPEYFISESIGYNPFLDKMNDSLFSLCPRGYGPTSFRICEALELNSIPVYIYDSPCRPFASFINMEDYCVMIHESDLDNIDQILKSKSVDEIDRLKKNGKKIYKEYYTYEGCAKNIIKYIE